ncbi:NRDE family protein [soil metagenome]
MCVLSLAWRTHPRWRLVMAGNRDELHSRPAAPLARWDGPGGVIAGRDLLSGGTWAGVSEQGRFAVVTNLGGYGPPDPARQSRGALLKDQLSGEGRYAEATEADLGDFNPFNLITAQGDEALFWSNRPKPVRRTLTPGLYGLSNGALDEPWPKTQRLKTILDDWLSGPAVRPQDLLDGLQEDRLIDTPTPEPGAAFQAIFIRNPLYGTRCGTVVAIDEDGRGLIAERRFDAEGAVTGETVLDFVWPA